MYPRLLLHWTCNLKSRLTFRYHESSQMSSLVETFVSKASALQRQGRAGRVRNGFCFRLYPKFRFVVGMSSEKHRDVLLYVLLLGECYQEMKFPSRFDAFMDYSIPEILRVPLEELCLHIMVKTLVICQIICYHFFIICVLVLLLSLLFLLQKCQYGSPEDFLSRALDPPQPQSVSNAVNLLRKIGACHPGSHLLTPLGHHLASLPVNVKIGKMLIYGAIFGCLEPIVRLFRRHRRFFCV